MTLFNLAKEREYAKLALDHCRIKRRDLKPGEDVILPTIRPRTPAWAQWRYFFQSYFEFVPYAMLRAEQGLGSGEYTVPCERPEQLVAGYQPPSYLPPLPPEDPSGHLVSSQRRVIVQRMQDQIRRANRSDVEATAPSAGPKFLPYSEEQLRAMYPPANRSKTEVPTDEP